MSHQNIGANVNKFWVRWLTAATIGVILFGMAFMVLPETMQAMFNLLLFGDPQFADSYNAAEIDYLQFAYGVLGAVLVGWMIAYLLIIIGPFKDGNPVAWQMLTASLVGWYIIDTSYSILTGYWQNGALNTGFVLLFAIPLAATYRTFYPRK